MLMAIGATRRSIMKIFLIDIFLISLPAGFLGIVAGIGFAKAIACYSLDISGTSGITRLTLDLKPEFIIFAIVFAMLLNVCSAIYPAHLAPRLDPVEAIGSE